MKQRIAFLVFAFLQFLTPMLTSAQTTEMIKGREFIVHHVKHGETVYGISKKYEVSQDTIIAYNKSARSGIKTDQILKFPSKNASSNTYASITLIKHTVQKGETLYGIAKKYNVTVEDIEKANPQASSGIRPDDVLLIPSSSGDQPMYENPVKNTYVETTQSKDTLKKPYKAIVSCDSVVPTKKNYKVALILPFKGNNAASSKIATEFYYGYKVAVDSVASKMKVGVKLYVMNSSATNDSDKVDDQYDFNKLKEMDLIIGPLFTSNIKPVAQFALENKIPFVSPFTKSATILEGNPFAIKVTPSDKTLAKRTIAYFNTTFPNCNFILVNTNARGKDSVLHANYYQAFEEFMMDSINILDTNRVHRINSKTGSPSAFFKGGVKNVVIYMNSKEPTVKSFITGFNKAHKSSEISLVGTEGWLEFNNVEADYYMNLNLHIPVSTYPDFTDSTKYEYFIRKYQYVVKADPTEYSFKGYKIGSDLMSRFFTYGSNFCDCIDQPKYPDEKLKPPFIFYFERKTENDGWENSSIQIIRVEDKYVLNIINY